MKKKRKYVAQEKWQKESSLKKMTNSEES